ncbi:uncharacterized protein LOC115921679 isoform X2 [Strongylocentrotus purpuratus]|uniref:Fibronectin type-III domain-containing protein n=1 Tax=Strongylocentrotus purpuratus TaxID=7668 RepID=A0A7M7NEX1_STRPU|nr:uncharacterized protein LOC115921679 isoform X2 [Strongylocentrotus purpuratus]
MQIVIASVVHHCSPLTASTVPNNNSTSLTLVLTVPQKHLYSKKALLVWFWHPYEPSPGQVMSYFITYQQEGSNSKTVITVDTAFTSETLRNLQPDEPYRAFVKAVLNSTDVPYIDSALTQFETPKQIVTPPYEGKPGLMKGLITMAMMLCFWVFVVLLFLRQWRIIRQLEPTPTTRRFHLVHDEGDGVDSGGVAVYKPYEPQNIDTIRVVKNARDSVLSGDSPKRMSLKRSSLKPAWADIKEDDEEVESDDDDVRLSTRS